CAGPLAPFRQASGAMAPLRPHGCDHRLQFRRAPISPARPDHHHLLPHALGGRGPRRTAFGRMDRLASHACRSRRLPRRAARDASRLRTLHWAMLLALVATFGYALYNLATRYLAAFDPARVTQTYTPLAGFVIMAPFAFAAWQ